MKFQEEAKVMARLTTLKKKMENFLRGEYEKVLFEIVYTVRMTEGFEKKLPLPFFQKIYKQGKQYF